MTEITADTEKAQSPPLSDYEPWKIGQPDDGIIWLYKSDVDGFWRIIQDEDRALEEATGYPIGELRELERMGDSEYIEYGELRAVFLPPAESKLTSEQEKAVNSIQNARELLDDFEDLDTEMQHGAISHAISELENAKRALPDDY